MSFTTNEIGESFIIEPIRQFVYTHPAFTYRNTASSIDVNKKKNDFWVEFDDNGYSVEMILHHKKNYAYKHKFEFIRPVNLESAWRANTIKSILNMLENYDSIMQDWFKQCSIFYSNMNNIMAINSVDACLVSTGYV